MFKEKRLHNSYISIGLWNIWSEMLFAIEFRPLWSKSDFTFSFGLTILYRELFYFQYVLFKRNRSEVSDD